MGLFDDDFNIEKYIQSRTLQLSSLDNRELFRELNAISITEIYNQFKEEYAQLQERVFKTTPHITKSPNLLTAITERDKYDLSNPVMKPMVQDDLIERQINSQEMLSSVGGNEPFYLYTCLIKADYLELSKLVKSNRIFSGTIENEIGQTPAKFILKPNQAYRQIAQSLYKIGKLNCQPWRTINITYLYKLFDVYVVQIESWDAQLEVKRIQIDLDEFEGRTMQEPLPLWNVEAEIIKANSYPQPVIDRSYYEHYLYQRQFQAGYKYLLRRTDLVIHDIFWKEDGLYIMCDSELPEDWEFYRFSTAPNPDFYDEPLMSNEQNESFSANMVEHFGQRINTKTELIRYLMSFKCSQYLEYADAQIIKSPDQIETYSMEDFILNEFRNSDRLAYLQVSFRPKDEDFYLNRDIMSFLMTNLQHFFPEYECIGRLI